jgi:asparagine synthase (glutamine-hydrolysing)
MFSLPPSFRIKGFRQKYLLKKVAGKYLPPEIINRPKAPFSIPLRSWLKNDLKEMVSDLLSENSVKARGIFNPGEVTRIIRENQSGKRDHSQLIFRMIVTELWFRGFF